MWVFRVEFGVGDGAGVGVVVWVVSRGRKRGRATLSLGTHRATASDVLIETQITLTFVKSYVEGVVT